MAVLDDVKALKNDSFISDNVYKIYVRIAESKISNYLNNGLTNAEIEEKYPDAVIELALILLNRQGDEGVNISKVSSVQTTYEENSNSGLPLSITSILPAPRAKFINTYAIGDYYGNGDTNDNY